MTLSPRPLDADGECDDPALDPLDRTATAWVIRLTGGDATLAEMEEFRRWRDEHPAHAAALAEARRHWLLLGHVADPEPLPSSPEGTVSLQPRKPPA